MRGILFKTVKEGFRRLRKQHASEVRRSKKTGTPVIPYDLKKADFKRKIRGTKFTGAAEFKAKPGLKRRLIIGIEKGRRRKKELRKPVTYGKAFASDRAAKRTLQIQPLSFKQRKLMKKEMEQSAKKLYEKMFLSKKRKRKGGLSRMANGGKVCFDKNNPKIQNLMGTQEPKTVRKGGMSIVKKVKTKLEKASAAHAGQAKALGRVLRKKKYV